MCWCSQIRLSWKMLPWKINTKTMSMSERKKFNQSPRDFLELPDIVYCYVFYYTITNICVVYSWRIVCYLLPVMYKNILFFVRFFLVLHVCDNATITQQCRIVHFTFRWTIFLQLQSFKAEKIWKLDIRRQQMTK